MQAYMEFIRSNHGAADIAAIVTIFGFSYFIGHKIHEWRMFRNAKVLVAAMPVACIFMASLWTLIMMLIEAIA